MEKDEAIRMQGPHASEITIFMISHDTCFQSRQKATLKRGYSNFFGNKNSNVLAHFRILGIFCMVTYLSTSIGAIRDVKSPWGQEEDPD